MDESKNENIVNGDTLSRLFGVTLRNVQQLAEKGVLSKSGHNKYPLEKNVKSYCQHLRDRRQNAQDTPAQDAKLRLTVAQAEQVEIKNEIARGNLVPIELLTEILGEVSGQVAGALDTIPSKIKRKHRQIDNQIIDAIKYQIVKAMNSIATVDEIAEKVIDEYIANNPECSES